MEENSNTSSVVGKQPFLVYMAKDHFILLMFLIWQILCKVKNYVKSNYMYNWKRVLIDTKN